MNELNLDVWRILRETGWSEWLAVITGIVSVWLSKRENIWVYPVGLINTVIYSYLCIKSNLFGEASVNVYYTAVSIYGWIIWARRNERHQHILRVTTSTRKDILLQLAFFGFFYMVLFAALWFLKEAFYPTLPGADAFASATAFTGMWLMARKKVESWYWWIVTNMASVPLFFIKGMPLTSIYYLILLTMSFFGLADWKRRARLALQDDKLTQQI